MSVPRPTGGTGGSGIPIDFLNGSILNAGDPSYGSLGAGGGIEQVCSIDYRQRWEGGRLWFYDQSGAGVREVRMNFGPPSVNDDDRASMRFRVDSRWVHQDGREWVCRDATEGAAVWDLVSSQPKVIYVTKAGNDSTGDGTMTNPFLTPAAAFAHVTSLAVNALVDFGVGSFTYTSSSTWPYLVAGVRGQSSSLTQLSVNVVSSSPFEINADNLLLDVTATGTTGTTGANGTTTTGSTGDPGGDGGAAPDITILGSATVGSVSSTGGNGGTGGNGIAFDEEYGQGGVGGRGGDAVNTAITIRCPRINGTIAIGAGVGGQAGVNSYDSSVSPWNAGANGNTSNTTIITDGAYMVGSSLSSINWKAGRCSYSTGSPTTDFGGNAIIS